MYQDGGALFSEGAYGCIFYPSLFKTSKDKYVSKIQKDSFSSKNEIFIGDLIKTQPYYLNHFVPVVDSEKIEISQIDDEDVNECRVLKKNKDESFVNLKIFYIKGKNFLDYIITTKSSDFNFVTLLINSYNHLLNSLNMLLELKIVHYDLKGNNIMFNEVNKLPLILDFGLSIKIDLLKTDTISKYFYVYAPEYVPWSLEIHYLCFLVKENANPTMKDLESMINRFIFNDTHPVNILFSNKFIQKYKQLCMLQLMRYKEMGPVDSISYILSFWHTWDNYALSMIYMSFFYYIYSDKIPKQEFIKILLETLLMNIHPNPEKRLTVQETSLKFNEKLLDFVSNMKNFKFISNLNKDFVENKDEVKNRMKKYNKKIDSVSSFTR